MKYVQKSKQFRTRPLKIAKSTSPLAQRKIAPMEAALEIIFFWNTGMKYDQKSKMVKKKYFFLRSDFFAPDL